MPMGSALFFDGRSMTPSRIMNITRRADGQLYRKIRLRNLRVKHLRSSTIHISYGASDTGRLFRWANSFSPTKDRVAVFHSMFARSSP
jgi:hypothetical protein